MYDPLAHVGFYNPKDIDESGAIVQDIKRLQRENLPADALPHAHLSLTLYCYLRQEGPTPDSSSSTAGPSSQPSTQGAALASSSWRPALERALKAFSEKRKLRAQQGTSNVASPAHFRNSNTPRGIAGSRLGTGHGTGHGTGAHRPTSLNASRLSAVPEHQTTPTR